MKKENSNKVTRRDFVGNTAKALTAFMILPRFVLGGKNAKGVLYTPPSDLINLGYIGTGKQGQILSEYFLKTGQIRILALSEVYQAKAEKAQNKIKAFYEKQPSGVDLQWSPEFADVSGNLGYTYGPFTFSLKDSTGKVNEVKGIFHTVWKKQKDGRWKFVWD